MGTKIFLEYCRSVCIQRNRMRRLYIADPIKQKTNHQKKPPKIQQRGGLSLILMRLEAGRALEESVSRVL